MVIQASWLMQVSTQSEKQQATLNPMSGQVWLLRHGSTPRMAILHSCLGPQLAFRRLLYRWQSQCGM